MVENSEVSHLLQQGASLRDVEHTAYFPTQEARGEFIYRCLQAGFRLRNTSEPPEPGAGFGAIVFHKDIASDVKQVSSMLTSFATEFGGRYDGWEKQA